MTRKFYYYLIALLLFALLCFLTALYPAKFAFREQNKAGSIAAIILCALALAFLVFLIIMSLYSPVRKHQFKPLQFLKDIGIYLLLSLVPYALAKPVIAGAILFINSNLGTQQSKLVHGKVVYQRIRQTKGEDSEVHVADSIGNLFEFTTFPEQAGMFWPGSSFRMHMAEGCLGLKYKKADP